MMRADPGVLVFPLRKVWRAAFCSYDFWVESYLWEYVAERWQDGAACMAVE